MTYSLSELSEQELNSIINALAQQPYIQVYQLIDKMQKQFAVQQMAQTSEIAPE